MIGALSYMEIPSDDLFSSAMRDRKEDSVTIAYGYASQGLARTIPLQINLTRMYSSCHHTVDTTLYHH